MPSDQTCTTMDVEYSGRCCNVDSGQVTLTVVSLQGWLLPFQVNGRRIQQQCFHMRWWITWYQKLMEKKEQNRLFFIKQIPLQSNIQIRKTSEWLRSDKNRKADKLNLDFPFSRKLNGIGVFRIHITAALFFFAKHFPYAIRCTLKASTNEIDFWSF